MELIGRVDGLWRYPVKSMRGQRLAQAFAGFSGIYGDRWYAFLSSGAVKGFPFFTGRERQTMLLYNPSYRNPKRMLEPLNLPDAEALAPGVTPLYAEGDDMQLDVATPAGDSLPVDDPRLIDSLCEGMRDKHRLTLHRSHRAMTDCRPISLFSRHTAQQLSEEVGVDLDLRRFRANIYLDLQNKTGFAEDQLVGRTLRIGDQAVIAVLNRDPRCKMITLNPDSGEANPEVMRVLARRHEGKAGLYGAVLVEGTIQDGDPVSVTAQ